MCEFILAALCGFQLSQAKTFSITCIVTMPVLPIIATLSFLVVVHPIQKKLLIKIESHLLISGRTGVNVPNPLPSPHPSPSPSPLSAASSSSSVVICKLHVRTLNIASH